MSEGIKTVLLSILLFVSLVALLATVVLFKSWLYQVPPNNYCLWSKYETHTCLQVEQIKEKLKQSP